MSAFAYLFPGQLPPTVRAGAALHAADPQRFARWMDRAEAATGLPIGEAALTSTDLELAQPALVAVSLALVEAAEALGLRPDAVAGHGVGALTAAAAARALDADDALRLAAAHGRLLAEARDRQRGVMSFVLGLDLDDVAHICARVRQRHGYVAVAQVNTSRQVVISGHESAVAAAVALATRDGAAAALVPGGGAFNSSLMALPEARLLRAAGELKWMDASVDVVSGGQVLTSAREIRLAVVRQTTRAVRWTDTLEALDDAGCRHLLEVGPGWTLTALAREHSRDVVALSADAPAKLAAFAERVFELVPAAQAGR